MRGRILIVGTVFAIFLFSVSIIHAAGSKPMYCHKNGEGSSQGTVTIYFVMGSPRDTKEPARECNDKYSSCGEQCWGCVYWEDAKGIALCYDNKGNCQGLGCSNF